MQKQEDKDVVNTTKGKGPYYDSKYYKKTIGESSNSTVVADAKIKQGYNFLRKRKPESELEVFPFHPVPVGCTTCYKHMMASSSNHVCINCHKRARTVEELNNK